MPANSSLSVSAIVLGGITLFSSLSLFFYYVFGIKKFPFFKAIGNGDTEASAKDPSDLVVKPAAVTVDDDEDEDEDEDEREESDDRSEQGGGEEDGKTEAEKEEEERLRLEEEANKTAYDDANRLAKKFIAGQSYVRAAEKLSEALDLAQKIPSAAKDIMTLYNNRSAMYEKSLEYAKSLQDIVVVLMMDPFHIKARGRRARIYEAQGKSKLAFDDFVHVTMVERAKGMMPSNQAAMERLSRKVALEESEPYVRALTTTSTSATATAAASQQISSSGATEILLAQARPLPSRTFCRNFMDTIPCTHRWKQRYLSESPADSTSGPDSSSHSNSHSSNGHSSSGNIYSEVTLSAEEVNRRRTVFTQKLKEILQQRASGHETALEQQQQEQQLEHEQKENKEKKETDVSKSNGSAVNSQRCERSIERPGEEEDGAVTTSADDASITAASAADAAVDTDAAATAAVVHSEDNSTTDALAAVAFTPENEKQQQQPQTSSVENAEQGSVGCGGSGGTAAWEAECVACILDLVCFDLANESYSLAFETLDKIISIGIQVPGSVDDYTAATTEVDAGEGGRDRALLWALYHHLRGIELHLRCRLLEAKAAYSLSIAFMSASVRTDIPKEGEGAEEGKKSERTRKPRLVGDLLDVHLMLTSIHLELGLLSEAEGMYQDILADLDEQQHVQLTSSSSASGNNTENEGDNEGENRSFDEADAVCSGKEEEKNILAISRAWVHAHRSTLWITRDAEFQFRPDAISKALADVDAVLEYTKDRWQTHILARAARYVALLKSINIIASIKQQTGVEATQAELERNKESIAELKQLFPTYEAVMLMEAELISVDGNFDAAMSLVDPIAERSAERGGNSAGSPNADAMPLLTRASLLTAKAFAEMESASNQLMASMAQQQLVKVGEIYDSALTIEPNSVEALVQSAQFKSMVTGDFQGAAQLARRALALGRSRDEIVEIYQVALSSESQFRAIEEMRQQN